VLPLQQPFGHDPAVHVHVPFTQACPDAQPPQAAPPVPHWLLDCDA
jgi:hypothetical protein